MTKALDADLKKFISRTSCRDEWAKEVLRRYHAAILNLNAEATPQLRAQRARCHADHPSEACASLKPLSWILPVPKKKYNKRNDQKDE
jgi:hypothetical protein